jgi:hypothetical protein
MKHWEIIHTDIRDGFKIELAIAPEEGWPDLDAETTRQIEAGSLLWFTARVTASRHGVVLGTDYLGECCYANADEFLRDGYYESMVEEVIGDARRMIEKLEIEEQA